MERSAVTVESNRMMRITHVDAGTGELKTERHNRTKANRPSMFDRNILTVYI